MVLGSCSTSGYLIGRSRTGSALSPSFPWGPGTRVKKVLRARPDADRASSGGFLRASSRTERSAPIPGPPLQACPAGGSVAPNADRWVGPRGPGQGRGDNLGSLIAEIQPAEGGVGKGGRSQRRWGWHSERLENILTPAAPGPLSQTERPGLRLGLGMGGSPSCREARHSCARGR